MTLDETFGTMPHSFLGHLAIRECSSPSLNVDSAVWTFPCGLSVSDRVAGMATLGMRIFWQVHARHHVHRVDDSPWHIVETLETIDLSEKVTVSCDCDA